MRRRLPDLLILLLLLLPLLMFWQQTVGGKTLLPADNLYQYQPYAAYRDQVGAPAVPYNALVSDLVLENFQFKSFIRQSIAHGEFPLWNPYQFSGIPFFAAGQQSTLYPFSVIYYILPLAAAYGWFMVSQLWLAGLFMFLFARGLGLGRSGALVAGVIYQLSAFFVISAVFPMIVAAAVWLPLILLMIEFIIERRPLLKGRATAVPWLAIGAGTLGCAVLAGHVEITYYTLLVSAYYAAARLIYRWWKQRHAEEKPASPLRDLASRGLPVIALLALGLGLGAIQFIPTFEAAQNNFRSDTASFQQILDWAHPKRDVIQFLMPNFYGNPSHHSYLDIFSGQTVSLTDSTITSAEGKPLTTIDFGIKNYVEGALYVGILPLVLAIYGLVRRRSVHQIIMALLGLASLTFMFGLPTYALIYILPGINQLHSPFRWIFPLTLCIALLAGFGMDSLVDSAEGQSRLAWAKRFGFVLAAIGALSLIGLLVSRLFYPQIAPLIERLFNGLAQATQAFSDARMFYSYEFVNVLIFGVIVLGSGVVFLWAGYDMKPRYGGLTRPWHVLMIVLIAADLMIASYSFNPAADPALLDYTPPSITWLQNQPGQWRYTTYEDPTHADTHLFNANLGMRYGLRDIRGYESIIPKPYVELMSKLAPPVQLEYNRIAPIYTTYDDGFDPHEALTSPILDLLNIRYVISDTTTTIDDPGYTLAYEDKAVRIWQRGDAATALPAAYTIPTDQFDVSALTVPTDYTAATISGDTGRELLVDVQISAPLTLIVSQTYSSGWRAYYRLRDGTKDDEKQADLVPVQGDLQGVILPETGAWTVRLVYSPQSFQLGMFTTFISAVLIVLALGIWLWQSIMGEAHEANATVRVARNSVAPIILNLFNRGIDFMFAVVMLRILGPTDSGWYFYAGVIFVWFDIFTNFGLNLYLTREVSRDRSKAAHVFFNTSAMRIGLAILGVPLLLAFLSIRQATVTPPINNAALIAILILYIGLLPNSLSTGLTSLYYAFERAEVPATVATAATINKAVLGLLVLLGGFGIIGLAAVSIITNVLTLALLLWNGRDMIRSSPPLHTERGAGGEVKAPVWRIDRRMIRMMAGESWFLMLNHFLATIFFQIDVILIEPFHGAKMVGQYSVAYKWISALNIIPSFFTQALLPVMSRQAHSDREGLKRNYILAIKLLVIVALPLAVAFTFLAYTLVGLLGGSQFLPEGAIATQIMIWSIPIGWMNSLTQYVLIAVDMHRRITRAFVIAVAFNIVANLLFIPQYGYQAAAIITILSEAVLLVPFARLLHEAMGTLPWIGMIWRPIAAAGAMLLVLLVGWSIQPAVALVISGLVYAGVLLALRPLSADELMRLLPLLPSRLRRVFT